MKAKTLNGPQKSAVLCLALGPEKARHLLSQLAPDELERVVREMNELEAVDISLVRKVLEEYRKAAGSSAKTIHGGPDVTRRLLQAALGEAIAEGIIERSRRIPEDGALARLEKVEPKMFASMLLEEHPQTVAVILTHIEPRRASKAIQELPSEFAADVLGRMARMDKISPEVFAVLEEGLHGKADLSLSQDLASPGDAAKVAKLLSMTGGGRDEELLAMIGESDDDLAARIKALMFVFEDLMLVDGKGIQRILRETDNKDLALALKGTSPELRQHIRSNMSERAADALDEEIELLGAVRVRDVEAAQQRIMEEVRRLEQTGEVVVRREGSGDEFIA